LIRNLWNSKHLLLMGAVVLLAALSAAGCETTFPEKSGQMPNESTSKHVKGYQTGSSEAMRPVMPLPVLR
jgi:outer membrane lipoprotein SlyB